MVAMAGDTLEPTSSAAEDPSCVFCRIVAGIEPAHLVFDDDVAVGFLDRVPLFPGHVLVVPRRHVETLTDLPAHSLPGYFARVQRAASVVEGLAGASGTFVAMNNRVSQSVPHLHTHVVPRRPKDGLRGFFWPRTRYGDDAEAARTAQTLAEAWDEAQQLSGLPGAEPTGE
ncbi:MAG: HIT family protein [Microthrixaceae bacterium]|nr:HIT family protein [Microthrixaceae bacterium]